MPTLEIPSPADAQAVADRYARSVEAWRSLPAVFDRATARALGVITVEWTQGKARQLQTVLGDVLSAQLAVLDNYAASASAAPLLAGQAHEWAHTRDAAVEVSGALGESGPLRAPGTWRSDAGHDYTDQARARTAAAGLVAENADTIADVLGRITIAGVAFTVAVSLVIEKTSAELAEHADALASGVGVLQALGLALRAVATAGEFIIGAAGDLIEAVQSNADKLTLLAEGGTV